MRTDSVDDMISGFAQKLAGGARTSLNADMGALNGLNLSGEPEAGNTHLDAARAIKDALTANTGRRKKVDHWWILARKVMGKRRICSKDKDKILKLGREHHWFLVDNKALSFPILVLDTSKPLVEVLIEEAPEPIAVEAPPPPKPTKKREIEPEVGPPKTWDPSRFLACGHQDHQYVPKSEAECSPKELARLRGGGRVAPMKNFRATSPEDCWKCAQGKSRDSYRDQKLGHQTPIPKGRQRTEIRERSGGFPGLCACPKTGFYIGGLGNDCRRYSLPEDRCVVHRPKPATK